MNDVTAWLERQARNERGAIRLEDALLANRFARYFVHRLRFFVARTFVATLIHAIKVVLLYGAFPRDQFLAIIILQAALAVAGDFWWGALERLRGRIRQLQRRGTTHLAPREIGRWLTLSGRLSLVGVVTSIALLIWWSQPDRGGVGPAELYAAAMICGAALDATARTYHSGAYAIRRVYRPLPSLIAVDLVSLVVLLGAWPLVGIWAFPISEILSSITVLSITLHYTTRTYRALGFPTLVALLRARRPIPSRQVLRSALAPGVAFAMVGVGSLILIASLASADVPGSTPIIVLLAALGPVIRADFEWARLLYFDLKRLDAPLLAGLLRRFDRAMLRLALVIGVVIWLIAISVGVLVLGIHAQLLLVGLLPLFVTRSLLAAAQMRAFTGSAYLRLALVGGACAIGLAAVFFTVPTEEERLIGMSVVLGVSFLALLALPAPPDDPDRVLPMSGWFERLRLVPQGVFVTVARFDDRISARGVTAEARMTELWRRRVVGRRIAGTINQTGGAVTWFSPTQLAWFEPVRPPTHDRDARPAARVVDPDRRALLGAGLIDRPPVRDAYPDGATAAVSVADRLMGAYARVAENDAGQMVRLFTGAFKTGIVYAVDDPVPAAFANLTSGERAEVFRAALIFARELRSGRDPARCEVTSLASEGRLRYIFMVSREEGVAARRRWTSGLRAWTLRAAAVGARDTDPRDVRVEAGAGTEANAML